MTILTYISQLFTEKKCLACHTSGHFFCPQCNRDISLYEPYCYISKEFSKDFLVKKKYRQNFPLLQIIVLTRYKQKSIKKLLRHAKYYNKHRAYEDLIFQNRDFFDTYIWKRWALFIPVPMHFFRRWKRGYNHSEKIARYLSEICGVPFDIHSIKKSRYTKQQSKLSLGERQENLSWSYRVTKHISKIPKNTTLYLVDDIISTGSTLWELASLFRQAGFSDIRAVVLASD